LKNPPKTLKVALSEGSEWQPFVKYQRPSSPIGNLIGNLVHAIMFDDGSVWDACNGWRYDGECVTCRWNTFCDIHGERAPNVTVTDVCRHGVSGRDRALGRCYDCDIDASRAKANPVERPDHYMRFNIEPIRFMMENDLSFWAGNAIKYIVRWDAKGGVEDLKKARRYLDMKIKQLEGDAEFWK
jgi:hypothetical protein